MRDGVTWRQSTWIADNRYQTPLRIAVTVNVALGRPNGPMACEQLAGSTAGWNRL